MRTVHVFLLHGVEGFICVAAVAMCRLTKRNTDEKREGETREREREESSSNRLT